jgi:predicted nucleic acid-binding protein
MIKYPLYVTLDTNIFVANKFDYSKDSTLGLLVKYVAANKIKIVLSNIVIKEVEKHVVAEGNKVCGALRKLRAEVLQTASKEYLEQVGLDVPLQILDKKQYEEKSRDLWKKFAASLKPEILDTSKIDLDAIIADYFSVSPPFENSDKKRKEF